MNQVYVCQSRFCLEEERQCIEEQKRRVKNVVRLGPCGKENGEIVLRDGVLARLAAAHQSQD